MSLNLVSSSNSPLHNFVHVDVDSKGNTPLHLAVNEFFLTQQDKKKIELLIEKGADINSQNGTGHTALHLAVDCFNQNIAKLLIEKGAEINTTDSIREKTPLHSATERYTIPLAKLLIENGAAINFKDKHGKTPLYYTMEKENSQENPEMVKMVELLIEKGASPSTRTQRGKTPLSFAKEQGFQKIVAILEAALKHPTPLELDEEKK